MRLNQRHRDAICERLIKRRFDPVEKELKKREKAIAVRAYNAHYSSSDRAKMRRLPKGWLCNSSRLKILGVLRTHMLFELGESRSFAHCDCDYSTPKIACPDDEVAKDIRAYERDMLQLRDDRNNTMTKVRGVLHSVTTVKALIDRWPEAKDIIEDVCQTGTPVVSTELAVQTKELNEILGLPPKPKKTAKREAKVKGAKK